MDPKSKEKKYTAVNVKTCAYCLAPQSNDTKVSDCSRCGLVAYCSKDCQRTHWKANHKSFCIPKADRAPPPVEPTASATKNKATLAAEGDECADLKAKMRAS